MSHLRVPRATYEHEDHATDRATRIVGAVAATAGSLPLSMIAAPVADAAPCPDVEVVFARGTTEPPGVGGIGQAFVDSVRSQVGGRSVGVYAVNYPASNDFASSTPAGSDDMSAHVQAMAANCPEHQDGARRIFTRRGGGRSGHHVYAGRGGRQRRGGGRVRRCEEHVRRQPVRRSAALGRPALCGARPSRCASPTIRSASRAVGTCVPMAHMFRRGWSTTPLLSPRAGYRHSRVGYPQRNNAGRTDESQQGDRRRGRDGMGGAPWAHRCRRRPPSRVPTSR